MFKTDKVVFKKLSKLPIVKRMEVAQSNDGPTILSSLTPSDFALLFPRYYREQLPDIGGFDRATTEIAKKKQSEAAEGILERLSRTEKGVEEYISDKYQDRKSTRLNSSHT